MTEKKRIGMHEVWRESAKMTMKASEMRSQHRFHSISVVTEAEARQWLTEHRNAFLARASA